MTEHRNHVVTARETGSADGRWQRVDPREPLDDFVASLVEMGGAVIGRWRMIDTDQGEPAEP